MHIAVSIFKLDYYGQMVAKPASVECALKSAHWFKTAISSVFVQKKLRVNDAIWISGDVQTITGIQKALIDDALVQNLPIAPIGISALRSTLVARLGRKIV